jgi:hypothetical protein
MPPRNPAPVPVSGDTTEPRTAAWRAATGLILPARQRPATLSPMPVHKPKPQPVRRPPVKPPIPKLPRPAPRKP